MPYGNCSICDEYERLVRTWCPMHYQRWRRHGDPEWESQLPTAADYYRRMERKIDRSSGLSACHPWGGAVSSKGYGNFWMQGSCRKAHVVAWESVHGPVPPGIQIDHECHNLAVRQGLCRAGACLHRRCCNSTHLIARTAQEHADATEAWERPTGRSRLTTSVLTEENVRAVKMALAAGIHYKAIAAEYRVHPVTIHDIKTGRTWSWL